MTESNRPAGEIVLYQIKPTSTTSTQSSPLATGSNLTFGTLVFAQREGLWYNTVRE